MDEEFMNGSDPFDHDAQIDAQQDFKDTESERDEEAEYEAKKNKVDAMVQACLAEWLIDLSGFHKSQREIYESFVSLGIHYGLSHK